MASMSRVMRTALVAIVNGDSVVTVGLQALMGRATRLITSWRGLKLDGPMPIIAYTLFLSQTPKNGDTRRFTVQFTVIAVGNDALEKVETIIARLEEIITATALDAQGVNAVPLHVRVDFPEDEDPEGSRGVERGDLHIELEMIA